MTRILHTSSGRCLIRSWPILGLWLAAATPAISAPGPIDTTAQSVVEAAVEATRHDFAARGLQSNQLAVTLIDLRDREHPRQGSYRGDVAIYPASVVKLFYLVAAHQWMEDRRLTDTPELRRAMHDMIVLSYNEATHYVVDVLTGTTSGPELPEPELDAWFEKRNAVNRYFASQGYTNIVANKKPWCEAPYGRESQSIQRQQPNRNMLTTAATARLLTEIVSGRAVTPARSREMLKLLERDPFKRPLDDCEPDEGSAFTGLALPAGAKLWSKAGWTSDTRHDAAYVELASGARFVLVTFTVNHANERGIIEAVARHVITRLEAGR